MLPLFAAHAHAQSVGAWTHPDGLYTLEPAVADARLLAPYQELASFQLGPEPEPVRMCFVRHARAIPNSAAIPQEALNERIAELLTPQSTSNLTISDHRTFDRDGVTVTATRVEASETVHYFYRFALASPRGAQLHEINCGGTKPVTATEESAFVAFLESLHFTTSRSAR
jgi:hypothetical protein